MKLIILIITLGLIIILDRKYNKYNKIWFKIAMVIIIGTILLSGRNHRFKINKYGYTQIVRIPPFTIDRGPSGSLYNEYRTILSTETINNYFDSYEQSLKENIDIKYCGETNNNNIYINEEKNEVYAIPNDVILHTKMYMTKKFGMILLWDLDESHNIIIDCEID